MALPGRGLTVRTRMVIIVVALCALSLAAAGAVAFALQRERVDDNIEATLIRTTQEFGEAIADLAQEDLAASGDVDLVVWNAMAREVPAENEGTIGFVDGEVAYRQPGGLDVTADAELVEHLTGEVATDLGRTATVTTSMSTYRYALLPIDVAHPDGTVADGAIVVIFDRDAEQQSVTQTFQTYALVALACLVVIALVAWLVSSRLLAPLRDLREVAGSITETDLSRRIPVRGRDDVSQLAEQFNAMIARLEGSFASQRQLLDDAGHELRTPITVVRGHLELMDANDPEDAAETRDLAVAELDRMHRLTDDLVMLAKTESADFIQPRRTSIGELTDTILDRARTLGDRRWRVDQRLEAHAELDAQRLTQAMLQLCANAVKFSDPGSTIAVGSALKDGVTYRGGTATSSSKELTSKDSAAKDSDDDAVPMIRLWVRDEGWGISEEDQRTMFERFARSTSPQKREKDGAGLGLAIVAGIVTRHGGTITVTSQVGAGSMFVLEIPAPGLEVETLQIDRENNDGAIAAPPQDS